jgi:hypothetical protein
MKICRQIFWVPPAAPGKKSGIVSYPFQFIIRLIMPNIPDNFIWATESVAIFTSNIGTHDKLRQSKGQAIHWGDEGNKGPNCAETMWQLY